VLAAALLSALAGCRDADPFYRFGHLDDAGPLDDDAAMGTTPVGDAGLTDAYLDCPGCALGVLYTCRDDGKDPMIPSKESTNASFILDVTNRSNDTIALADVTLRYWYTREPKPQALDCDLAKLGCSNVVTSASVPPAPQPKFEDVLPPRVGANTYVEIAFTPGALSLEPGLGTGEIQLRVHNKDRTAIHQNDDYSFFCGAKGVAVPSRLITAYVRGVLAWGLEPPR
jgi:hypothetical protein